MRSENVFSALVQVPNRFLLTKLAAKATRKFHRPYTRIQQTLDEVFVRFSQRQPMPEGDAKLLSWRPPVIGYHDRRPVWACAAEGHSDGSTNHPQKLRLQ